MDLKALKDLIKVLKANNVATFKSADIELTFSEAKEKQVSSLGAAHEGMQDEKIYTDEDALFWSSQGEAEQA
jgi:hypothetical protein